MSVITLKDSPEKTTQSPNIAQELLEQFGLTEEHENLAQTAMLAMIAQANLSENPTQKDYAERLMGFFSKYQQLVQELHRRAVPPTA